MGRCGLVRRFSAISRVVAAVFLGIFLGIFVGISLGLTARLGATALQAQTSPLQAQTSAPQAQQDVCVRPEPGSAVAEPAELRSHDGILETDLSIRDQRLPDGTSRYCYLTPDGKPSPTLRVKPGDQLVIHFKNDLVDLDATTPGTATRDTTTSAIDRALAGAPICTAKKSANPCESGAMTPVSTNLHFHGLTVPPVCHQDDVLKTSIQPGDPPFEYRLRIPDDEPPGLYWYHPHIHGFSKAQVLGGASGALIIEGIERADPALAGMPERVLVIRDQDLVNPDALPSKSEPVVPKSSARQRWRRRQQRHRLRQARRRICPSISCRCLIPNYPPARHHDEAGREAALARAQRFGDHLSRIWLCCSPRAAAARHRRARWRADAISAAARRRRCNGSNTSACRRARAPSSSSRVRPLGVQALLVTRTVDTGPGGENDPNRALAAIDGAGRRARAAGGAARATPRRCRQPRGPGSATSRRCACENFIFSEKLREPERSQQPHRLFIMTDDGQTPKPFDPHSDDPGHRRQARRRRRLDHREPFDGAARISTSTSSTSNCVEWSGIPVNEPFLRDTVNVPYFNGRMLALSQRAAAHGFSRSQHRRHVRLPLPRPRTRGRRHDGQDQGRAAAVTSTVDRHHPTQPTKGEL